MTNKEFIVTFLGGSANGVLTAEVGEMCVGAHATPLDHFVFCAVAAMSVAIITAYGQWVAKVRIIKE